VEQRLSLITLGVRDLEVSTRFYEALGWRRSVRALDGVRFFQLGGIALSLYPFDALAADAGLAGAAPVPGFSGVTLAHNVRSQGEVDAVLAEAVAAGGTLQRPAQAADWGGYSGYLRDPDGHLWEIAWNPHFPLDAAGGIRLPD
jgi:hypothetical protein